MGGGGGWGLIQGRGGWCGWMGADTREGCVVGVCVGVIQRRGGWCGWVGVIQGRGGWSGWVGADRVGGGGGRG